MTRKTLLALLIIVTLTFASYAAWQETKTALAIGVITAPSGAGTFQLPAAYCGEMIPGAAGWCHLRIQNRSAGTIHVDDFSVTSRTPDVVIKEVVIYPRSGDIPYDTNGSLDFEFHVAADATQGEFVFDASVTCSGG